jgi:hypothetical protein
MVRVREAEKKKEMKALRSVWKKLKRKEKC